MLLFPEAKIIINALGEVCVTGVLTRHSARIARFLAELDPGPVTIRYARGKYHFPRQVDAPLQQRIRNFLVNECPVPD